MGCIRSQNDNSVPARKGGTNKDIIMEYTLADNCSLVIQNQLSKSSGFSASSFGRGPDSWANPCLNLSTSAFAFNRQWWRATVPTMFLLLLRVTCAIGMVHPDSANRSISSINKSWSLSDEIHLLRPTWCIAPLLAVSKVPKPCPQSCHHFHQQIQPTCTAYKAIYLRV